jgi:hypothetical protein
VESCWSVNQDPPLLVSTCPTLVKYRISPILSCTKRRTKVFLTDTVAIFQESHKLSRENSKVYIYYLQESTTAIFIWPYLLPWDGSHHSTPCGFHPGMKLSTNLASMHSHTHRIHSLTPHLNPGSSFQHTQPTESSTSYAPNDDNDNTINLDEGRRLHSTQSVMLIVKPCGSLPQNIG